MALKETLLRATVGAAMFALTGGAALAADDNASTPPSTGAGVHSGANAGAQNGADTKAGADMKGGAELKSDSNAAPGANADQNANDNAKAGPSAAPAGNVDENAKAGAAPTGEANALNNKPETPPKSLVGNDVINAKGEKIGEVSKIEGDQLIVSSGGFLGIGTHDVAIPWSRFTMQGAGDKSKLEVSMTKDELKQMPEYKEPKAAPAGGTAGTTGGATGGATGGELNGMK